MFERFTESARYVVVFAQEEARTLAHDYVGTEHFLLGLLRDESTPASDVLAQSGVTHERVLAEIGRVVGPGRKAVSGQIPFTPRAKRVLELALRAALNNDDDIGTRHLLLGLIDEHEGVAMLVLTNLGVNTAELRTAIAGRLEPDPEAPSERAALYQKAGEAIRAAAETAAAEEREVDSGDLIIAMAQHDDDARKVLERYVSLDQLARAFAEARKSEDPE